MATIISTNPLKKIKTQITDVEGEQDFIPSSNYQLDTLPPEILETIFKYLNYEEISKTVRIVSRRFHSISTSILNNAFLAAGSKLVAVEKYLSDQIVKVKGDSEILNYQRAYNSMELIQSQYQMLKAVTWRYTHPISQKFSRLCFYAGFLLDILFAMLKTLGKNPIGASVLHESKAINDFISISKRFMNHFEKISEKKVNKSASVSGCKIIDILDCLVEGREIQAIRISANRGRKPAVICMKIKYVIKRAWFTCLEVQNSSIKDSWRDEQKFMYLRLRRLVSNVNIHLYKDEHFRTELNCHTPQMSLPKPPSASSYYGYGECGGTFFYYGVMNKCAYENKFKIATPNEWPESDDSLQESDNSNTDLEIVAGIRCSPELAPLSLRSLVQSAEDLDALMLNLDRKLELYLKLSIKCPTSTNNRLPGNFTWELKTPSRRRD